jgi:hypothetical protein
MKVYEQIINEISEIQKEINQELDAIESYESENESLKDTISDYENEYDYDSDPDGNHFDLSHISDLNGQIEINDMLIKRCELEIEILENLIIEKLNTKNCQTV